MLSGISRPLHTTLFPYLFLSIGFLLALTGCRPTAPKPVPIVQPPYFTIMERGYQLEQKHQYEEAITLYRSALADMKGGLPDLRTGAAIASHNRIGACYRSLGQKEKALLEFRASLALGDRKYATEAIAKLTP